MKSIHSVAGAIRRIFFGGRKELATIRNQVHGVENSIFELSKQLNRIEAAQQQVQNVESSIFELSKHLNRIEAAQQQVSGMWNSIFELSKQLNRIEAAQMQVPGMEQSIIELSKQQVTSIGNSIFELSKQLNVIEASQKTNSNGEIHEDRLGQMNSQESNGRATKYIQNSIQLQNDKIQGSLSAMDYARFIRGLESSISTARMHEESFKQFKNKHAGQVVVMCGAAPSLQLYRPMQDAVHLALNRSFLYDKVDFDYIFASDFVGISHITEEIKSYKGKSCVKFFGTQNASTFGEIPESLALECGALRFMTDKELLLNGPNDDYDYDFTKSEFAYDLSSMRIGNFWTIALQAIQFILYTHPRKIYIVGCDFSGGHFNNKNLEDGDINKQVSIMQNFWAENGKLKDKYKQTWYRLREFARIYYPDVEIISVNPVELKGIFHDEYTSDYLKNQNA